MKIAMVRRNPKKITSTSSSNSRSIILLLPKRITKSKKILNHLRIKNIMESNFRIKNTTTQKMKLYL